MSRNGVPPICAAIEGLVDEAVLRRLVEEAGGHLGPVHGKHWIRKRLAGLNRVARFSPWVVLVDLDHDAECAPPLRAEWLSRPAAKMCFRVAVREVEAWLLADCANLARFLGVASAQVPADPEALADPKRALVDLARRSRRSAIRQDLVPTPQGGREVGPAYTSRLIEFASRHWDPKLAARRSDSLRRSRLRIRGFVRSLQLQ